VVTLLALAGSIHQGHF